MFTVYEDDYDDERDENSDAELFERGYYDTSEEEAERLWDILLSYR